jgi:hypothetical protein
MSLRRAAVIAALLLAAACAAPVATTAVAVGAASYQREHGGCVAACTPGHACNPSTGFCDPVPCAAGCPAGQACVATATGSRCEPREATQVEAVPR